MQTVLTNAQLTVTADTRGGELHAIDTADGSLSYLWNADPAYWGYHAPTLFPFIGALRGDRAQSAAGEIHLPKHGLARTAEWALEAGDKQSVTFRLDADEHTRAGYPYDFSLQVCYRLYGACVTAEYTVSNNGDSVMPYCLGGHPAFRVPLEKGENFADYRITFAQPETADCPQVNMQTGLIRDGKRNRFLTDADTFALNHVVFRGDALVFDQLKSRSVKLYSANSGHGVQMDFGGMDYFAIWSPMDDAPFVCLEPWTGTATLESEDDVFEHKQGVSLLAPGQQARHVFSITVF